MSEEQSTAKFLFSKEGRGILIGTIVLIVVVVAIGMWTVDALFGSNDSKSQLSTEQREQVKRQSGESRVRASGQNIRANITSEGMTDEARAVLNDYNDQADELGLMPVPTPDNVTAVPVEPEPDAEDSQSQEPANVPANIATDSGQQTSGSTQSQQRPMTREELQALKETRKLAKDMLVDHRRARLEAANQVLAVYQQPPTNASMAFTDYSQGGSDSSANEPPRVGRNSDGSASFKQGNEAGSGGQCKTPLVKGGEIRYAQTDIALNTDFKGPVRMTFLDGEIAGYIGMGSFELNEFGARMKLKINRLFDPDGQQYEVSGYVLDPDTTLWAMASDVDHHIIYRYGGFGLGTILSSFSILAENRATESQITTPDGTQASNYRDPDGKQVTWTVLGEFSRLFEEAFKDNLDRPITVTLDPQEEAGVLFEDTVCEIDSTITRQRKADEQRVASGFKDPVEG